jgi:Mg-chelatase subunit ChlD
MPISFASPWLLLLAPIALAALGWAWRGSLVSLPPWRMRLTLAMRVVLVLLLAGALSRPSLVRQSTKAPVAILVDVSASVSDASLDAARKFVSDACKLRPDGEVAVVTFGAMPRRAPLALGVPQIERHDVEDTDLGRAIAFSLGLFPEEAPKLVIVSDGNETKGAALTAAALAAERGAEIDVVGLAGAPPVDARVTGLRFPDSIRRGDTCALTAIVDSTRSAAARVRLEEDDVLVEERPVTLESGSQALDFQFVPSASGLVRYTVRVSLAGDQVPQNDRYTSFASVEGPPRVLLVQSTVEEGRHLLDALAAQDIAVETVSPETFPATLDALLPYDEVMVAGLAPKSFDRLRQAALTSYVRDTGGGLLFVAGREGLQRDPDGKPNAIEALLPLELADLGEKREPAVAIVLLIDRSGSMIGEKLNYAKSAALAVIDKLSGQDQVGIIAFDARAEWVVPLSSVGDKETLKSKVTLLGAGGGTKFYPAMEDAYYALGSASAALRHAILLTDGVSTDPDIFAPLLDKMRSAAITVSTVAIGRDADLKLLKDIASRGGGHHTLAATAAEVPNIFVKETEALQKNAAQHADTFVQTALAAREIASIDFANAPALKGYVRTRAKAGSETLLETRQADPLLVRWQYGLGTVAAFASDATSAWAERWLDQGWDGFGKLWAQLSRGVQRQRARRDLSVALETEGDDVVATVLASDAEGNRMSELDVRLRVLDGAMQSHQVALPQVGPGTYRARLKGLSGTLLARPFATRDSRRLEGDWAFLVRPPSEEYARIGPDEDFLAELVRIGRGTWVESSDAAVAPAQRPLPRSAPLGGPLALVALAMLVLDVAAKRVRWEPGRTVRASR